MCVNLGVGISQTNESSICGTAKFTAGREMAKKSGSKIDEEGLQVAVCRYELCVCLQD